MQLENSSLSSIYVHVQIVALENTFPLMIRPACVHNNVTRKSYASCSINKYQRTTVRSSLQMSSH